MSAPPLLIRPPRLRRVVYRPRIAALRGDAAGVVFVGPTGAGKTVAAAGVAGEFERSAWVRPAPGYTSAADLVALTAAAVGVDGSSGGSLVELAGVLLDILEAAPTALVIDNYHEGDGDECDPLIAEVLPLVPPTSVVVLCSRIRPPGLVGRVRDGVLRVVSADELAFRPDEAEALFDAAGKPAAAAAAIAARVGGWPAGLVLAMESDGRGDEATTQLVRRVLLDEADDKELAALNALAVVDYLDAASARGVGTDESALRALCERTSLVSESGGLWRLADAARDVLLPDVPSDTATATRAAAAVAREASDPASAIDLWLANADPLAAAGVLGRHLSTIGAERAVRWLYQFPAELRRQFPPVLAAGRATVNLDEAVARAEAAVEAAPDEDARREALFALGSARAHAGRLSSAAAALESAVSGATQPALFARGHAWLGVVRWWAGDLTGARVALDAAGDNALAHWAAAEVALVLGDTKAAGAAAMKALNASAHADAEISEAAAHAVMARLLQNEGDAQAARDLAAAAYERAVQTDGFDLAVAGPTHAALLVNAGLLEEAEAVAAQVDRRIGRHDAFAKLHVYLLRAAIAHARRDRDAAEKAEASLRRLRQDGFAAVEAATRALLAPLSAAAPSLRVEVLGLSRVSIGGEVVPLSSWKSHKALEVLHLLALAGGEGRHREEVIEAVWPDRDPDKGRGLLRAALSEIRRRLEPTRQAGEASQFVQAVGDRIAITADTDLAQARALARAGRAGDALALFRGSLLEDAPYAEWAFEDRRASEALRTELAERVAADPAAEAAQRIDALEVLIAAEPWRERWYDELAALHRAAGDEAAARAVERRRDGD